MRTVLCRDYVNLDITIQYPAIEFHDHYQERQERSIYKLINHALPYSTEGILILHTGFQFSPYPMYRA